jgi:hypothetical protein
MDLRPRAGSAGKPHAHPRILVAGPAALFHLVAAALRLEAQLLFAQTMEQALRHVENGVCLIVCSERFDESRMFNFLHALFSTPAARSVPVICCREGAAALTPRAQQTIAVALEALGVPHFLDMPWLRLTYGADLAEEVLRALMLERLRARYRATLQRPA